MFNQSIITGRTEYHYPTTIRLFVSIYLSMVISVGICGNTLVCFVYGITKELHTSINMLIINLAVADILQSFNMIFMIISVNYGKWVLGDAACQLNGFMSIGFIITSLLNLFLISVNRYLKVCQPGKKDLFSKKVAKYAIIVSWIYPALLAIAPVIGWSKYSYRPGKLMCVLKFNHDFAYTITMCMSALAIPFGGICLSYYKIVKTIRKSGKRVSKTNTSVISSTRSRESRIAIMLGIVIVSFIIFYLPSSSANFYEMAQGPEYDLPVPFDLFSVLLAMLNHANNPIIYGFMNKNFRKPITRLLHFETSADEVIENSKHTEETELQIFAEVAVNMKSPMIDKRSQFFAMK